MKIVHGVLSALLAEVSAHGQGDEVRLAALMESTVEGTGIPVYTSWVIVSGRAAGGQWMEWRLTAGRQGGEITDRGYGIPEKLVTRMDEALAEVRGWIEAAGLEMRDGVLADDGEVLEGVLG